MPADKVRMRFGVAVIPFLTVNDAYGDDRSVFLKTRKIPVYRSEAQIRIFRLQVPVNPFGGRMAGR
jgi:hypothetical protein